MEGKMVKTHQIEALREKSNIGQIIRILMISRDKKTVDLANELRVTPAYINAITNNLKVPSVRLLSDFFEYFNISFEDFSNLVDFYNNYNGKEKFEHTLYQALKIILTQIK